MKKATKQPLLMLLALLVIISSFALCSCKPYDNTKDKLTVIYDDNHIVYEGDSIDSIKPYLAVTYIDEKGKSTQVTDFTLSGTLTKGQSKLNVSYNSVLYEITVMVEEKLQEEYTVTFVADGIMVSTQKYTADNKTIDVPQVPEKTGYNGAWEEYTLTTGNITINAVYTLVEYNVTFKADNTIVGTETYTVENKNITIPQVPQKTGYVGQWESFVLTNGNITVNVIYSPIIYEVTYKNCDDILNNPKTFTIESDTFDLNPITRSGYNFLGWYSNDAIVEKVFKGTHENITLEAHWEIIEYVAHFRVEQSIVHETKFTIKDTQIDIPSVPKKNGYIGVWSDYALIANDIDIIAIYSPIEYSLSYKNTKDVPNDNPTKFTVESEIVLENLSAPNYRFDGWFDNSNNLVNIIEPGHIGDIILTAKWTPYVDIESVGFNNRTFIYDGTSKKLECNTLPQGVTVEYTRNQLVNVGSIEITATFYVDGILTATKTAILSVNKANYDMSNITFPSQVVTYNGEPQNIYLNGELPSGIEVSYDNNAQINVGRYQITAKFSVSNNYYELDDMVAYLTINKADYDMSNVAFGGETCTYDGNAKSIYINGTLPQDVTVSYIGNEQINAGTYTVTAMFANSNKNYNDIPNKQATLIINKATYNLENIEFKNRTVEYNGLRQSLSIEGELPAGLSVVYENNECVNVGKYEVVAKFIGNNNNYYNVANKTATLTICKGLPQVNVTNNQELNVNSIVELIAETDVQGSIMFNKGQTLKLGTNMYEWTFTPTDTTNWQPVNGTINLTVFAIVNFYNGNTVFETKNIAIGNSIVLPESIPTKADAYGLTYLFKHWSLEGNGEEISLSIPIETNTNLYAVFSSSEIQYSITYLNTKESINSNRITFTVSDHIQLQDLETNYYEFDGWYDDNNNRVESIDGIFENISLTAKWNPIQYSITYNLGYLGITNFGDTTYNIESSMNFIAPNFDEYHEFSGWYLDEQYTDLKPDITIGEHGNITLYAKWNFLGKTIATAQEFQYILYNMSGAYELNNDITIDFTLGDETNPFTGYLFGNNHTISTSIDGTAKTDVAVIAINNGIVRNLKTNSLLCNTNNGVINFCNSNGGFAKLNNGEIRNSHSNGYASANISSAIVSGLKIQTYGYYTIIEQIGGVASVNTGTIINCVTTTNISANGSSQHDAMAIGGIAGFSSGTIENSYFSGNITATYRNTYSSPSRDSASGIALYCGGILGHSNRGTIKNCYTQGNIDTTLHSATYVGDYNSIGALAGCYTSGIGNNVYTSIEGCFVAMETISFASTTGTRLSQITTAYGNNCYFNQEMIITKGDATIYKGGQACNIINFTSRNFMLNNLGWKEYIGENEVASGNVWIFQDGQYPKLYFEI